MKQKIKILYQNRAHFSGYMLTLILQWRALFQNRNFRPDMMGHNSVLFVERALERISYDDKHHIQSTNG